MIIDINNLPKVLDISDCDFTGHRDRIYTNLILMDYDWMHYRMQAEIPYENNQVMLVEFLYFGLTDSQMTVQVGSECAQFSFSTEIFDKYFKKYLDGQKEALSGTFAFSGEEIVIDFYNHVMKEYSAFYPGRGNIILPSQ